MSDKLDLIKKLAEKKSSETDDFNSRDTASYSFKKIVIIAAVILIALAAGYYFFKTPNKPIPSKEKVIAAPSLPKVNINTINYIAPVLSASGYVTARRIATIAAEITGKIEAIYFEEGQKVAENQLLAKLDATLAQTEKEAASARLISAKANVQSLIAKHKKAKFSSDSKSKLYKSKVVSEEVFVQAQAEVESITAELEKAKNDVNVANIEIERQNELVERHFLRAPFSGIITSKDAHPGEVISPISGGGGFTRTGIATIVDMDSLEVEVDVNESNINKVTENQSVKIVLDAYPDKTFKGNVIAIIPSADRDKATIKVRIGFQEKSNIILPNMAVKVDFFANDK